LNVLRRERGTIVRSRRVSNCGGRPLKLTVRPVSTWRRKAQEMYPDLSGALETWDRFAWNYEFSQILSRAVAADNAKALAHAVRYLHWCWSQRSADEQFLYFVETTLRHILARPADRSAFLALTDDSSFSRVLEMYSSFHDKKGVADFERERRFSHRPNQRLERP
jgi:hypothetical protein